jgi:hypothetical protein
MVITLIEVLFQPLAQYVFLDDGCESLNSLTLFLAVFAQHPQQASAINIDISGDWIVFGRSPRIDDSVLCIFLLLFGFLTKEVAISFYIIDGCLDAFIQFSL